MFNQKKKNKSIKLAATKKVNATKGPVVIKIGGSALKSQSVMSRLLSEVAELSKSGYKIVLVHGGGAAISNALASTGEKAHFIEGLRVTDDKALAVAQSVLDKLNATLVSELQMLGVEAKSVDSCNKDILFAAKKFITCSSGARLDIGWVGEISDVDETQLQGLLDTALPVVASLAHDQNGQLYNVNADNVALAVAVALKAEQLVYITDVPGILLDGQSVMPKVSLDEISILIDSGIIRGGMIPKVRNCASGIKKGIGSISICNAEEEGDLLSAVITPGNSGTVIVKDAAAAA